MSFCIRNTSTSQAPTVNYLSSESSSVSNPKVIFEEKISITSNESVLKFDMTTNSWVWREINDNSISSSIGPSGRLINIQNSEVVNIIENQSTDNIQSKKVEIKNKKRKKKKK
jgi:hypothetical protein